eukprot:Awhi_evm2s15394
MSLSLENYEDQNQHHAGIQDTDSELLNNNSDLSNNESESEISFAEDQQHDFNKVEELVSRIGPNKKTISKRKTTKPTLYTRSTPVVLRSSLRKNNLRSAMLRKR